MSELVRLVEWTPAFDKRHADPSKNYGIHGMEVKFVLKGPSAATQFVIYTNWHLAHVQKQSDSRGEDAKYLHLSCHPLPADVGYHSLVPVYEGQTAITESCPYLNGKPCYYDGSSLQAEELYWRFVAEGDAVVWKELESRYNDIVARATIPQEQEARDEQ